MDELYDNCILTSGSIPLNLFEKEKERERERSRLMPTESITYLVHSSQVSNWEVSWTRATSDTGVQSDLTRFVSALAGGGLAGGSVAPLYGI